MRIPTDPKKLEEVRVILEEQRQRFVAKFGRQPTGDDPVFFDVNGSGDKPGPFPTGKFERDMTAAMIATGRDDVAYAWIKTGIMPATEQDWLDSGYTYADRMEWNAAIDEFRAMSRQAKRKWRREQEQRLASEIAKCEANLARKVAA